jgi:nitrogen fixation/metabolism regulation signal transduction histidine kinase
VEDQGASYTESMFELLESHFSEEDTPLNLTMGIGLAVSQMIMEEHGGHLVFQKSQENRGQLKMVFPHE